MTLVQVNRMGFMQENYAPENSSSILDGLYPVNFDPSSGQFTTDHITFGAYGDSFYEYLLKSWLLENKTDHKLKLMYDKAMVGMKKHLKPLQYFYP